MNPNQIVAAVQNSNLLYFEQQSFSIKTAFQRTLP